MNRRTTLGLTGLLAGTAAGGVGAAVALQKRAVGRARRGPDPHAHEPFGRLHDKARTVYADDGVPLHVEEAGDPDAPLTVVFVHGFTLSMDCWHFQRRDLTDLGHLVFYDQRSHGASGHSRADHCTIDQLGRDLDAVLRATAPTGPVVLVGHSMGGMTIMALADQRPELFGERVVGVALLGTSPGRLGELILGLPSVLGRGLQPLAPRLASGLNRQAHRLERGRRSGTDLEFLAVRRIAFGGAAPPSLVEFMAQMIGRTPVPVMSDFFPTFIDHDKLHALGVLAGVQTLVLAGDRDLLTPPEHSRDIAREVPSARLVVVRGAGHMVILEKPELVNDELRALVGRAVHAPAEVTSA